MESIKNQIKNENSKSLIAGANKDIKQKSKAEMDAIAKKERIKNNAEKKAKEKESLNEKNAKGAKSKAKKEGAKEQSKELAKIESNKILHYMPNRAEMSKDEQKAFRGKRRRERDSKAFQLSNAFSNGKDFKEQLKDFIAFLKINYPSYSQCKDELSFLSCLSNKLWKGDSQLKAEEKNQKIHLQKAFKAMQKAKESKSKLFDSIPFEDIKK